MAFFKKTQRNESKSEDSNKRKKSPAREWFDSILFAVIAASLIRWILFEPFQIPTSSMENSLLVGDFLFVSKLHYGARTTKTPLQVPLTHQKIWGTEIPAYLDWIELPQWRLPSFDEIERNDVVVFNYPAEEQYPSDLRTNYIKRCVAIAGDELEIKNRVVYTNGNKMGFPKESQHKYLVVTSQLLNADTFYELGIPIDTQTGAVHPTPYNYDKYGQDGLLREMSSLIKNTTPPEGVKKYEGQDSFAYIMDLSEAEVNALKKYQKLFTYVAPILSPSSPLLFPFKEQGSTLHLNWSPEERTGIKPSDLNWTMDNFGPLKVPNEGWKMPVTSKNLALYGKYIMSYEGNENVEITNGTLKINGNQLSEYVFKQDYYFMMGDNRHSSADSRYWGFVPADHVVGKATLVWLSIDPDGNKGNVFKRIRWNRSFSTIDDMKD